MRIIGKSNIIGKGFLKPEHLDFEFVFFSFIIFDFLRVVVEIELEELPDLGIGLESFEIDYEGDGCETE